MISLDILIPMYADTDFHYYLFRLCIESILNKVPGDDYSNIIIIDDHSRNVRFIQYMQFLERHVKRVRLVRLGEPCVSYYAQRQCNSVGVSSGHGGALNEGLRYVNAEFVMVIDPDSLILKRGIIRECMPIFSIDSRIMAAGQLTGDFKGSVIIDREKKVRLDNTFKNSYRGIVNACLMIVKMEAWGKYGIKKFNNSGWAHGAFAKDIYEKDLKQANFDFYRDCYALHFGGGILNGVRYQDNDGTSPLGFDPMRDSYERKQYGEYYAGNPDVRVDTDKMCEYLKKTYGEMKYDIVAPCFPEVKLAGGKKELVFENMKGLK